MSCRADKITKKRIAMFSGLGAIASGVGYISTTMNNPVLNVAVPAILTFALCPIMCAVMGGVIWFVGRFKKNSPAIPKKDNVPN